MSGRKTLSQLSLKGLHMAPSQTFGAVRLVPLIRTGAEPDLRLYRQKSAAPISVVQVDGAHYLSFVPHAFVLAADEGHTQASLGGQLFRGRDGKPGDLFQVVHRMAKRTDDGIRFLPLHLAMEYFLALCFGGPDHAWPEYSKKALRHGLSPRSEESYLGLHLAGLEEALRMFEIHDGQVGVALFVADALASVFVVPRHDDYRALHRSLLLDFFGELLWHYARIYDRSADLRVTFDAARVSSWETLNAELQRARLDWSQNHSLMLDDVLGRKIEGQRVTTLGKYSLERFMTVIDLEGENHMGEAVQDDHEIVYLKTYRLSAAQARRAHLLHMLSSHDWHLDRTATALRSTRKQLVERIVKAGFGELLRPEIIADALKSK